VDILYFAYGSCMDEVDFKRTVERYKVLGNAALQDYKLSFSLYGKSRGGGVADIIFSPEDVVEGVLYQFDSKYLPALDVREGVAEGAYQRIEINVTHQQQLIKVYTYQVVNKSDKEIKPTAEYVRLIVNGLQKHGSEAYLNSFKEKIVQQFQIKIR
jgi:gamma-glutamylcyclotransferase (GGCT)/AIG2-like uncharacterized protein YtfP